MPADIDESLLDHEEPVAHARRLAEEKVGRIATKFREAVVIAADTIVVIDGDVLGKPSSDAEAREMLARLSGRSHVVHTAVAVAHRGVARSGVESVSVQFRPLTPQQIAAYVATGEPMDKAGAYGIQGFGATIVAAVHGDYFAVMGLPLGMTVSLLRDVGVDYTFGALSFS